MVENCEEKDILLYFICRYLSFLYNYVLEYVFFIFINEFFLQWLNGICIGEIELGVFRMNMMQMYVYQYYLKMDVLRIFQLI